MIMRKRWALVIAVVLVAAGKSPAGGADPNREARWRCPYTPDGVCTPNRLTYGYFPTHWRKWPIPEPFVPAAPKATAEEVPPPPKSISPPATTQPVERQPATKPLQQPETLPGLEPPLNPFSDEEPPISQPEEMDEPKDDLGNRLKPSKGVQGVLDRDLPDTEQMEQPVERPDTDNPLNKDDPSSDEDSSMAPRRGATNPYRAASNGLPKDNERIRWRSVSPAAYHGSAPAQGDRQQSGEPRRLRSPEAAGAPTRELRATNPQQDRANPLRASPAPSDRVAPTASWTSVQSDRPAEASAGQTNPLRARQ